MPERVGIIGGSGFYAMEGLERQRWVSVATPFGKPSDRLLTGVLEDQDVVFLARHGQGHRLLPGEINYRANIYALKKLSATRIVAASAVGSLREEIKPLDFVILDQLFDRTTHRESTFFGRGVAVHVSFGDPFCESMRRALVQSCQDSRVPVHSRGTYVNMEGPAFSTRAESRLYRAWGMDVIGMTNLVEAKLAREAEICYATMAMVTDYDCWHDEYEDVTVSAVLENLRANTANAARVIRSFLHRKPDGCVTGCNRALAGAILTSPQSISAQAKKDLKLLIGKYM